MKQKSKGNNEDHSIRKILYYILEKFFIKLEIK